MKAVQFNQYGGPEVLELNGNVLEPTANSGQVLIEVRAVSINPFDVKLLSGALEKFMPLKFPAIIGSDFSGIVKGIRQEVYGQSLGSFAQVLAVKEGVFAPKPKSISFEEAAALPLVGCSAIQALEEHIKLLPGQKILIHGGAGGIGHIAIQLAKALGAYAATTVKTDDFEFVKKLGVDEVIDYQAQKFEDILKDFDAVYDLVGEETTIKSFQVLKRGGVLVSMLGQPSPELAEKYNIVAIGQGTKVDTDKLNRLAKLVDEGKIKVHVEKIFPLEQFKEAFTLQMSHPRGKLVIRIKA